MHGTHFSQIEKLGQLCFEFLSGPDKSDTHNFLHALPLLVPYEVDSKKIGTNQVLIKLAKRGFLSNGNRTRSVLCLICSLCLSYRTGL